MTKLRHWPGHVRLDIYRGGSSLPRPRDHRQVDDQLRSLVSPPYARRKQ